MAFNGNITTSLMGRRMGLQLMSTGVSGGTIPAEFLVGPEALRTKVTTAETSAINLKAWGISNLPGSSAASTSVYTLDAPIPGVDKYINFGTTGSLCKVRTGSSEVIQTTTLGATGATCINSSQGGAVHLIGLTTAIWMSLTSPSSINGVTFTATT